MNTRTQKISPHEFAKFKEALLRAELEGYGPDAAAATVLRQFGFPVVPGVETRFEVDWAADGQSRTDD